MSFNYENRRELAANRSYQASVAAKRDLLAQRIKNGNKTTEIDISKVLEGIKNGDLSVLEELDRAGISYTLTNNGQPFDGKLDDDYYFACEYNGTTYTAEHKALTREQEEAKKKSGEPIAKRAHSLKEFKGAQFISMNKSAEIRKGMTHKTIDDIKPLPIQEPAPDEEDNETTTVTEVNVNNLLNNAVYATTAPANTTVTAQNTSETTQGTVSTSSTGNSTTVAVDKNKADALLEELKNAMLSADAKVYVDHGVTNVEHDKALAFVNTFAPKMTEIFMAKYGYTKEFAQILTDAIIEKSFWDNYDRVGAVDAYEKDNENTVKKYNTKNILKSIAGYLDDTDSLVYHNELSGSATDFGSMMTYHNTCYKMQYYVPDYGHCRCVASGGTEYQNNDFKILDTVLQEFYKKIPENVSKEKVMEQVRFQLCQLLNVHGEVNGYECGTGIFMEAVGFFPIDRLNELDKDGNGYLDDIYQILNSALEYKTDGKYQDVKYYLEYMVKYRNENNDFLDNNYTNLIQSLDKAGIEYSYASYDHNDNGYNNVVKFNFYGVEYEITMRCDFPENDFRTVDDISDQVLEEYLNRGVQWVSIDNLNLWSIITDGKTSPLLDDPYTNYIYYSYINTLKQSPTDVIITGSGPMEASEIRQDDMSYQIGQILQNEYGITKESTDEQILEKLREYIISLGLDLNIKVPNDRFDADRALKSTFATIEKDLIERFPEYKNAWKEMYIKSTRPKETYHCTINTKPSENNNTNTLDAKLLGNIQMLAEHPEYKYYSLEEIKKLLNEMNIEYEEQNSSYKIEGLYYSTGILNFTFNDKDYQIVLYSDVTPNEDTRTIEDITDAELNAMLNQLGGYTSIIEELSYNSYNEDLISKLINRGETYPACFYHPEQNYSVTNPAIDNIAIALGQLLTKVCGINDLRKSKDENKNAFKNYLLSIGAYNERTKHINTKKLIESMCKDLPEFKDYIKALYIEYTKPQPTEEPHVIIRTRDAKESSNTEYSKEVQKYIDEAKSHFGISDYYSDSYLHQYLYNLYWSLNEPGQWSLDSIKKSMITICTIVSSFPELKSIVTEFFGNNYIAKINSYTDADSELLHCLSSNHPELVNPLMNMLDKIDEKMKEAFVQLQDPNNKNGYTDVYYK